jgi:hypothetical protein
LTDAFGATGLGNMPLLYPGRYVSAYYPNGGADLSGNLGPTEPLRSKLGHLVAAKHGAWSADGPAVSGAVFPCALQTGADSFGNPNSLLLGDGSQHCDHCLLEDSAGVQVWFGETAEGYAVVAEHVQGMCCNNAEWD